jgi:PKD repeat protein
MTTSYTPRPLGGGFGFRFACALLALASLAFAGRAVAASVTLAWDPVASPALAGYMVHYGPAAGSYTTTIDAGNVTTRTVPGLTEGATYHFVVTAYDASRKESPYSNDASATIPYSPPAANFSVSATSGVAPLALNFASTSSGNITGYAWTFGDGSGSTSQNPSHVYSTAGVYTVSLKVTGPGGSNTKTAANLITVNSPSDTSAPTAPSSLVANASGSTAIALAWNASADNVGVTGYRIERCTGTGCTSFAQVATSAATTFVDTGLVAATSYRYRVRATDAAGNLGAYSNVASATTWSGASVNVALAANGGVASASSTLRPVNSIVYVNDGQRSGAGWSTGGGGWADATSGVFPDWVQIAFDGAKTLDHVVVYSVQDDYASPVEPTDTLTFTQYGLTSFQVLGWSGSAWVTLASVAGNDLVKRTVTFAPYTTDRLRVLVTGVADGTWSRVTEVEAWTASTAKTTANYALAANGGVASASSTLRPVNSVVYVNDGQRSGAGWSTGGGGWADATSGVFPDWVQIAFDGAKTLDHVVVYSVQDDYASPVEPTDALTFTKYGLTSFQVQGWSGSAWVTLASVAGNDLVKRTVTFAPYTTDRLRVLVTGVADGTWSRITEIEAWGN